MSRVAVLDAAGLDNLVAHLSSLFSLTVSAENRTVSIPAPRGSADLAAIAAAVDDSRVPIDEMALHRPTLDEAFMALTDRSNLSLTTGAAA